MPDLLESGSRSVAFGLDELTPSRLAPLASGAGAIMTSSVYFGVEPFHGGVWPVQRRFGWLVEAATKITGLSTLAPGWDGAHAVAIDRDALQSAWELLRRLAEVLQVAPSVVPSVEGGVALEWHRGGVDLEIEIDPHGSAGICYEDANGDEIEGPLTAHVDIVALALSRIR